MDIIVDLESLGLRENAVLLSLAMTAFSLEDNPSINNLYKNSLRVKFNISEQIKSGYFTMDKSTISWWKKQDKEIIKANVVKSDNDINVDIAIEQIKFFLKGYNYKDGNLWARGVDFDIPKLKYLFMYGNSRYPFNPFKVRDVRTYIDILAGVQNGYIPNGVIKDEEFLNLPKHDPLGDTIRDAYIMQYLFNN